MIPWSIVQRLVASRFASVAREPFWQRHILCPLGLTYDGVAWMPWLARISVEASQHPNIVCGSIWLPKVVA